MRIAELRGKLLVTETRKTLKDLKDCCGQDTVAMVRISGKLWVIANG